MNEFITLVSNLVSNLGFPIACCVALFYYINTTQKELVETINKNTSAMEKLLDKLKD